MTSKQRKKPELFTLQVQGKGVRLKARVSGEVAAAAFAYAKEREASNQDTKEDA